jgi:predicted nucleic acid-binding protein
MSHDVAVNIVEAIARHPKTFYCEAHFRFHLLQDIDKDDDKFVDCAIASNADYIVTEDNHFNILKNISYPPLVVLSLDEFYNTIKEL